VQQLGLKVGTRFGRIRRGWKGRLGFREGREVACNDDGGKEACGISLSSECKQPEGLGSATVGKGIGGLMQV
jgi:hypothetical protein